MDEEMTFEDLNEDEQRVGVCLSSVVGTMIREHLLKDSVAHIGWYTEDRYFDSMAIYHDLGKNGMPLALAAIWVGQQGIDDGIWDPHGLWWGWRTDHPLVVEGVTHLDEAGAYVVVAYDVKAAKCFQIVYPLNPEYDHWWTIVGDPDQHNVPETFRKAMALVEVI